MKALGLIVEYNPFHNGHLHHLIESKKKSGADTVIAVMSGQFTQRGEPAIADKWSRAKMALDQGIDLVVELPYAYGVQQGEIFARGAVSILSHLQVECLVFGSESGNISQLCGLENLTASHEFQEKLRQYVDLGYNVPRAQSMALAQMGTYGEMDQLPNNTLGIQYIRANRELGYPMEVDTIPRLHSHYQEQAPSHQSITSATAIRNLLAAKAPVHDFIPETVLAKLEADGAVLSWEPYFQALRQNILTLGIEGLRKIHDMKEGLENRFYENALRAMDFEEFLGLVKTKRYTRTRLQRICAHILTGTTQEFINNIGLERPVPYVRILGMSTSGRIYLNRVKKTMPVPLMSKFSASAHPILKHEQKVTAAYGFALGSRAWTRLNVDEFTRFPLLKE
ncbi:MAG: nucleotidyltransferase [Turicibacter sp.]|nr:nucleotidyltransferase [Turicibacter sp.]